MPNSDMTTEGNKEVIRRYWATLNSGDARAATAFWADKPINHGTELEHRQIEALHHSLLQVYESITVHELVAEDDWVACRITAQGHHKSQPAVPFDSGIYRLTNPEGTPFRFQHIHMFRIADGKIKEHWANRDDLGAAKQLGLELVPVKTQENSSIDNNRRKQRLDEPVR